MCSLQAISCSKRVMATRDNVADADIRRIWNESSSLFEIRQHRYRHKNHSRRVDPAVHEKKRT